MKKTRSKILAACLGLFLGCMVCNSASAQSQQMNIMLFGDPDLTKDQGLLCKWEAETSILACIVVKDDKLLHL